MAEVQQPNKKRNTGSQVRADSSVHTHKPSADGATKLSVQSQQDSQPSSSKPLSLTDLPEDILSNILSQKVISYKGLGVFFKAVPALNTFDFVADILVPRAAEPEVFKAACRQGSVDLLERMLDREDCFDVNDLGPRNAWWNRRDPPLVYGILSGKAEVVRLLLSKGANAKFPVGLRRGVDYEQYWQYELLARPLCTALNCKHEDIAQILIEAGADVNACADSCSPLNIAVCNGMIDMVRLLLEKGATPSLNTSFLAAARTGNVEIAQVLLDKGANIKFMNSSGYTPIAVANGEAMTDFILGKGVNPMEHQIRNYASNNFLKAAQENKLYLMKQIFEKFTRKTFNPDAFTDRKGNTALMLAAASGHEDMVDLLISHGSDIETVNANNESALFSCQSAGMMIKLLEEGADAGVLSNSNGTVLHRLFGFYCDWRDEDNKEKCIEAFELALAGASVTAVNQGKQRTALHMASGEDYIPDSVVQNLLDTGKCDINAVDSYGYTALHAACNIGKGKEAVARMLIAAGADTTIKNKKNKTPFEVGLKRLPKQMEKEAALKAKEKAKRKKKEAAAKKAAAAAKKKKPAPKEKPTKKAAAPPPARKTAATKKKAPAKKKK